VYNVVKGVLDCFYDILGLSKRSSTWRLLASLQITYIKLLQIKEFGEHFDHLKKFQTPFV